MPRAHLARCIAVAAMSLLTGPAFAQPYMEMCRPGQPDTPDKTCIVDGDTLWLNGENIQLEGIDTPESDANICGGDNEKALAAEAAVRLRELLNTDTWIVERRGTDGHGRTLANIKVGGYDVGEYLVEERLARWWPGGRVWWCD